ncbi:MAG: C4-dicarboxylate ABC transporter substrate-binding protein [Coxiella sp. DG_40]|nr:MAG: C4-dicarboxylate ABC transporter substrate-binding protein [Coxiella sp. DG_40]
MSRVTPVRWVLTICLSIGAFSGCGKEEGGVKVLKLAHGLDTTHPVHKAMEFMAQEVSAKSEGRLRIDIYPSEQLGSERECIEQLQIGALDMTKTSSSPLESFVPPMKVLGLPYLFRDSDHYWKVLLSPIGKELLAAGEAVGLKGLCFYDAGARSFYTRDRLVNTPADLSGMKIRVQKSNMAIRMIEAMGASATPIDWGELYTSLQQGVVDGAENNPPSFYTSLHYEICKYYILDEHTRPPDVLLISTAVWNDLPSQFQTILQQAANESVSFQRQLWVKKESENLREVEKAGVTIIRPDKEPFRKAVKSMWAEFDGTDIGELAKKIVEVN